MESCLSVLSPVAKSPSLPTERAVDRRNLQRRHLGDAYDGRGSNGVTQAHSRSLVHDMVKIPGR